MRHFLSLHDTNARELALILRDARNLKQKQKKGVVHRLLEGKTLGMLFQKPSNRTRVSFEVGMYQLGGHALHLLPSEIRMKEREPIADIARVMSRYVDAIMLRVNEHEDLIEFAKYSSVPTINGLSDRFHPCQAAADLLTMLEVKGKLAGLKITYVGDGNNVCASLINAAHLTGMQMTVCCPDGFEPESSAVKGEYEIEHTPTKAVAGADVVYTDVWTSMGQEEESAGRLDAFAGFTVDAKLLSRAAANCIFMHCLPAHRGEEVTDEVLQSKRSVVLDQAENRLHAQKAILCRLLGVHVTSER